VLTTTFAPDPAVPARDRLLDERSASERLGNLLGVEPVSGRRLRAKYRIGESLRIVQRISDGSATYVASARTFLRAIGEATTDPHVFHDAEWSTVWWLFPADRRLRDLGSLLRPNDIRRRRLRLERWFRSEVVEYAPERSLTMRAIDDRDDAVGYIKAYAPGTVDTAALARRYDVVAEGLRRHGLPAASPGAFGHDAGALALQPMPGVTWATARRDTLARLLERLGGAIAAMHDLPLDTAGASAPRFGRLLPQRVVHSAELVACARPGLAGRCDQLAAALADGPRRGPVVLLHGDCHPKNALFDGDRVSLVDLDQAGLGDAAADVGSLLARLRHGTLLGEHDERTADALVAAFVAGYAAVRPMPDAASVRWHTAAALVAERAMRAVNRVQPEALATLPDLLDLAVETARR